MELDSRKKSKRDRMMISKSFETHEMREIRRKEAGEMRGFSILWMGIMEKSFRWNKRNVKIKKNRKCEEENPYQSKKDVLAWNRPGEGWARPVVSA